MKNYRNSPNNREQIMRSYESSHRYPQNRKPVNLDNSMLRKTECPNCNNVFFVGFDPTGIRECPDCDYSFITGRKRCELSSNSNNNIFFDDCPAIMCDGRFLTWHGSSNELTEDIKRRNNINNPNEFRKFMHNNGNKIRNAYRKNTMNNNTCLSTNACCDEWMKLWTKYKGNWANFENTPLPFNF